MTTLIILVLICLAWHITRFFNYGKMEKLINGAKQIEEDFKKEKEKVSLGGLDRLEKEKTAKMWKNLQDNVGCFSIIMVFVYWFTLIKICIVPQFTVIGIIYAVVTVSLSKIIDAIKNKILKRIVTYISQAITVSFLAFIFIKLDNGNLVGQFLQLIGR